jgi:hypothetical protein
VVVTKLWRNPESRRAVVTQALDYAAAVSRMTYAEFEQAVLSGEFGALSGSSVTSERRADLAQAARSDSVLRLLSTGASIILDAAST